MPLTKEERKLKRTQIIAVHEADGDWRAKAQELKVAVSTAYRWVREGNKNDERGGRRYNKVNAEHVECMVNAVELNPKVTLAEIALKLYLEHSLIVTKPTISRHLDAQLYTLKAIRFEPEKANDPINKEKRKVFVTQLLEMQGDNVPIIFMDETNFNIHISRTEGRSRKGTRCTTVAAGSKGANIHVIGGISSLGFIHYEVKRGSFKKENAAQWASTCLRLGMAKHGGNVCLVIDNAPCHTGLEDILVDELSNCKVLRLGPYSPQLNPIEGIWSILKSHVKKDLSEKLATILSTRPAGLSIKEHRLRSLELIINENLPKITPAKCITAISGIQRRITPVLNMEDLEW